MMNKPKQIKWENKRTIIWTGNHSRCVLSCSLVLTEATYSNQFTFNFMPFLAEFFFGLSDILELK